ncbi:MAG: hypothetical protein JSV09_10170 [Thermoplasmata archaeon]|nr:MAG: hypothetical protein JSV09_10170 [Thermoplasmata archaeon]
MKAWESEIEASRNIESQIPERKDVEGKFSKEEWLKEQRRFQADLINMRDTALSNDNMMPTVQVAEHEIRDMENNLKEREQEMEILKGKIEDLNTIIIEKDREIEKLKGGGQEFSMDEETRNILRILDDLLENLPENVVDKFARSDDYLLYERVLEKYKL